MVFQQSSSVAQLASAFGCYRFITITERFVVRAHVEEKLIFVQN